MLTRRTILTAASAVVLPAIPAIAERTPEERLRAAVLEVRASAMALGVEEYIVMVGHDESGIARLIDYRGIEYGMALA